MMENRRSINKKSDTRIIVDSFIEKKAVNSDSCLSYDDIYLSIPDNEKTFLLNNLIKDNLINVNSDGKMWFDQKLWNKTVGKLSRMYLMILIAPILITTVFVFLFKYLA